LSRRAVPPSLVRTKAAYVAAAIDNFADQISLRRPGGVTPPLGRLATRLTVPRDEAGLIRSRFALCHGGRRQGQIVGT
jgi:hypothetical protein